MARNGKIAHLPHDLREDLNQRLADGAEGQPILDWLNALPATREILDDRFNGSPITKQNLSEWRAGGFAEWRLRQELLEQAGGINDCAATLESDSEDCLHVDNVATVLAARFGSLLATWPGQPDEKLEATVRILGSLSINLVRLQRSLHRSAERTFALARLHRKEQQRLKNEELAAASAPIRALREQAYMADHLKEVLGDTLEAKRVAEILTAMKFDLPLPGEEKRLESAPETEAAPEPDSQPAKPSSRTQSKPVQPKKVRNRAKPAPPAQPAGENPPPTVAAPPIPEPAPDPI